MVTPDQRLRVFEGNMHAALKSWHARGGAESVEPQIAEMPFDALLRQDSRDDEAIGRIRQLHVQWQELQMTAAALLEDASVKGPARRAAQAEADEFYARHEKDFGLLAELDASTVVDDYDWTQRVLGARLVFRWVLAEGFRPLKIMKRLWAIGRAMGIEPFTQLTMDEQGKMFSETKAAVSFRMRVLSGLIQLRGMSGHRLSGQKTAASRGSYSLAQMGNGNRAKGRRPASEGPLLRTVGKVPNDELRRKAD